MKLLCLVLVGIVALTNAQIDLQMEGDMSVKLNLNHAETVVKNVLANLTESKKMLPPVFQYTDTLGASLGLNLIRVGEMREGWIEVNAYATYFWKAAILSWNPEEFGGVTAVRIPLSRMWYPDIVPFDGKMEYLNINLDQQMVVVSFDGSATWVPNVLLKFPCDPEAESDDTSVMNCTVVFGSWTYSSQEVNATFSGAPGFDLSALAPNRKYEVEATSGVRVVKKYACCAEKYITLKYSLRVKRLPKPRHWASGSAGGGRGPEGRPQGGSQGKPKHHGGGGRRPN